MRGAGTVPKRGGNDGLNLKGITIVAAVLLTAFGILYWVRGFVIDDTKRSIDITRMRAIYGALFLYESTNNGLPPADLTLVRRDLSDDDWLRSVNDPWPGESTRDPIPPLDPAFPNLKVRSPKRISFTYLPIWARYDGVKIKDWQSEQRNLHVGILACYWYGDIDRKTPDGRNCTGPVVRITMDGSARTVERRDKHKLTAVDMFGLRP